LPGLRTGTLRIARPRVVGGQRVRQTTLR